MTPMLNLEALWREYNAFEQVVYYYNTQTADFVVPSSLNSRWLELINRFVLCLL